MKKIKYLMLLLGVFLACPFYTFATSSLVYEINAQKEGESSFWLPIYVSDIEEGKVIDIYDLAKYSLKDSTLTFIKDGTLSSYNDDNSDDRHIMTNYNNTFASIDFHNGGKTYIGGHGKLKIEKSSFVYYNYYASVRVEKDGYNRFLNDENGNMYHTEDLGRALYNVNLDNTDFKSKAEAIIKNEWSNLQKWNSDFIGDIPFDPSYIFITTNHNTMDYQKKYANKELVDNYINTNLDIVYLDDGVLFDGSKVLEDNGVVFKSEEKIPEDYTLKAEDIFEEKSEEVENYNKQLDKKMMIGLFDISVNNGVTQVDIDSGKYTIRVPITDDIKDYTGYYVVYVKNGEIVDTIDAKVINDKYIEFNTTHLSEYGIIADKPKPVTKITTDITSIDFGTIKKGFTNKESDEVLKTIRITNTGNTTITINNTNPSESGPFGSYWFDPTTRIAPGEYMDIRLRLADGSTFANISGNYSGTYSITATNVDDANDKVTLYIDAKVELKNNDYQMGDMNRNGKIDLQDIIITLKKYLGSLETTDEDLEIGDMDGNGSIGIKDILLVLRAYLGTN